MLTYIRSDHTYLHINYTSEDTDCWHLTFYLTPALCSLVPKGVTLVTDGYIERRMALYDCHFKLSTFSCV